MGSAYSITWSSRGCGVLLHAGADGLEGDVVEAAVFVAAGRVALRRGAVPGGMLLEALDHVPEICGPSRDRAPLQHIGFGADQLVGFSQVGRAAVTHHLMRHPAQQRIAGDAGEGIRAATLQANLEVGQRLRRAPCCVDLSNQPRTMASARANSLDQLPCYRDKSVGKSRNRIIMLRRYSCNRALLIGSMP